MVNIISEIKRKHDEHERKTFLEEKYMLDKEVRKIQTVIDEITVRIEEWYQKAAKAKNDGLIDVYQKYVDKIVDNTSYQRGLETALAHVELLRDEKTKNSLYKKMSKSLSFLGNLLSSNDAEVFKSEKWKKQYISQFERLSNLQEQGAEGAKQPIDSDALQSAQASRNEVEMKIAGMMKTETISSDVLDMINSTLGDPNQ